MRNMKNARKETREITGKTRETLNRHEYDHTRARSSRNKVTRDPKSTRDKTRVTVLLREDVLIVFSGWRP